MKLSHSMQVLYEVWKDELYRDFYNLKNFTMTIKSGRFNMVNYGTIRNTSLIGKSLKFPKKVSMRRINLDIHYSLYHYYWSIRNLQTAKTKKEKLEELIDITNELYVWNTSYKWHKKPSL
jgi:hypothetical protein